MFVRDAIARDQGLPVGSLELRDPRDVPDGWFVLWK
jgi:hypothetical protein